MSLPTGKYSREWLHESRERMTALEEKLRAALPEQLYSLMREHPGLCRISWRQGWPGIYRQEGDSRFNLSMAGLEFDIDGECCAQLEEEVARAKPPIERVDVAAEHAQQLDAELLTFLLSIPVCVMVSLFGHSHEVHFYRDSYKREFIDQ